MDKIYVRKRIQWANKIEENIREDLTREKLITHKTGGNKAP